MKTCPKCNTPCDDNSTFCTSCGASFDAQQPNPAQQPTPEQQPNFNQQQQAPYGNPGPGFTPPPYAAAPVDPFDHTAEFDQKDISDNKVLAMLPYLSGFVGIIIALLAINNSAYVAFHVKQALKVNVCTVLCTAITAVLCWTFIVPAAGLVCLGILTVLNFIGFFSVCKGHAKELPILRNFAFLK